MERFLRHHPSKLQNGNFGPILAHKSGHIETTESNILHTVENIVFHLFKSKSQKSMEQFLKYHPSNLQKGNFGPILTLK